MGITALAALAFLNAGYDESDPDVGNAVNYIVSHRQTDGSIYSSTSYQTYQTSMAILALEATYNSDHDDEIEAARNWLINSQWDEDSLWPG